MSRSRFPCPAEHLRHRSDQNTRAILFDHLVMGLGRIDIFHRVFHARTAAFLDANAQARMPALFHQSGNLGCGPWCHGHGLLARNGKHRSSPLRFR
jgi:hypothetical protein